MMGDEQIERILRLAAFLARERTATLGTITAEVPGYETDAERTPEGELVASGRAWETVRRRLRRDLEALDADFGIVVHYDDADHRYRLAPPFLTPEERRELIAAAAVVNVDAPEDPGLDEIGGAVDPAGQFVHVRIPQRAIDLAVAIRERRTVAFRYRGTDRRCDPYAIGRWRTHWYLVGRDHGRGHPIVFRLDRIEGEQGSGITIAGEPGGYAIPDGFDATDTLRLDPNAWGRDPALTARIRVAPHLAAEVRREIGGEVLAGDDGPELVVEVRHYRALRDRLLRFGADVHLLGPPELVDELRDHLRAVAAEGVR